MTMPRLLSALFGALLSAQAALAASPAETYTTVVATAEQGHRIDAQALRDSYVRLPGYDPYAITRPAYLEILRAYYKGDYDTACPALEALLKDHYVETVLHVLRAKCMDRAYMTLDALLARLAVVNELTDAILKTGDGKSLDTAYRLVSFSELAAVSGRFHLAFDGVAEITRAGHRYLLIEGPLPHATAHDPKSGPSAPPLPPVKWMKLYFNIDSFTASHAPLPPNLFGGKPE